MEPANRFVDLALGLFFSIPTSFITTIRQQPVIAAINLVADL